MMHYEPYHHEQGNRSPLEQHLYSSTYMTGKIDQGQVNFMADNNNWQSDCQCCHPKPKPKPQRSSPPSVRFGDSSSVFLYEADEDEEEEEDCHPFFSPSQSEEISFKTTTNRSIMACRQELEDSVEDMYTLSNGLQRRGGRIKEGFDISAHLISSVSIRKNLDQILARKQVIRAVLDEQARQRQWNYFDPELIAIRSMEYSMVSTEKARRIGFMY